MDAVSAINSVSGQRLTPEQMAEVARLAARDRDVRAHEQAHMAAAGALAVGGIEYTYERGPDGKMYAVGGKVKMATSGGSTPEQALAEARQMLAAADAPSDPSGQDMAVAAQARQLEAKALQEIAQEHAQQDHGAGGAKPFFGFDRTA